MKISRLEISLKRRTSELRVTKFLSPWIQITITRTPEFHISFKKTQREFQIGWESILIRLVSVLCGLIAVGVIIFLNGVNPLFIYIELFRIAFFTSYGFFETLMRFIPLLCIAIGLSIPFKARIDNIGAEGQFIVGAIAATGTAFFFSYLPAPLLIPLMFLSGFVAGALWAIPVAIFRAKGGFKGSDVVLSFLLVFPAFFLMEHLVSGPWRDMSGWGFPMTPILPSNALIPSLVPNTGVHATILLAIALTFLLYHFLFKTTEGIPKTKLAYEINVMGSNPKAGEAAGMSFVKIALISMAISGGLAGIAGVGEVAGNPNLLRLRLGIAIGYGYTAIVVAWLGGLNPIGIIVASFFFAGLIAGGIAIQASGLPATIIDLFNGTILFFVVLAEILFKYKIEWRID